MRIKLLPPVLLAAGFFSFCTFPPTPCSAQISKDTLRVMAYNTLDFGPGSCQTPVTGQISTVYPYLKDIIKFANPDIIGLDKMQCVKTSASDVNGLSSPYFPDTLITECFDAAYPGRYAWCPFTDLSRCSGGNSDIIFYDQTKLTYVSTTPIYWSNNNGEDIDMFKFYYNEWLNGGADTTYLYVILCHTISGADNTPPDRDGQDSTVMNALRTMFTQLPNLIYMGDFNTHTSTEPGYEYITQSGNPNYTMDDPPFVPDAHLAYPDNWNSSNADQAYFTTTTRTAAAPNSCGTTGGAKDWYDHILLSSPIVNGTNNFTYVRNSYKTIGNNGNRAGINVNDSTTNGKNLSAPSSVLNAEFNFSDKYPVELTLAVSPALAIKNIENTPGSVKINNPIINNNLVMHFANFMNGQNITMDIYDVCGRNLSRYSFNITSPTITQNITLAPGVYFIHYTAGGFGSTLKVVKE